MCSPNIHNFTCYGLFQTRKASSSLQEEAVDVVKVRKKSRPAQHLVTVESSRLVMCKRVELWDARVNEI